MVVYGGEFHKDFSLATRYLEFDLLNVQQLTHIPLKTLKTT